MKNDESHKAEKFPFGKITEPLLAWFKENKRDLPWRHDPTPYRVWVSEIMLQQTRVEAAREYYLRFLRELPSVDDLARCDEARLMKLWEGLGYYSRARNLQRTAKIVSERYGGVFPSDEKSLAALPGIGDYTVGAIRSIAFGLRSPAVDGNVLRVCSRLAADATDISDPSYKVRLKELLRKAYPKEGKGCSDFTQALMELGALICTPRAFDCGRCPLSGLCLANKEGKQSDYPVVPNKKEKKEEDIFVFVVRTKDKIAVRKREKGILKGMNEFPSVIRPEKTEKTKGKNDERGDERFAESAASELGFKGVRLLEKKTYVHIFTHVKWKVTAYLAEATFSPFDGYTTEQLREDVAFPTAFRRCLEFFDEKENKEREK